VALRAPLVQALPVKSRPARRCSPPPYVPGRAASAQQSDWPQGPIRVWPLKGVPTSRLVGAPQLLPGQAPGLGRFLPARSGQAAPLYGARGRMTLGPGQPRPQESQAPLTVSLPEPKFAADPEQPTFFRQPAPQSDLPPIGFGYIRRHTLPGRLPNSRRPDCSRPSFWNRSGSFLMIVTFRRPCPIFQYVQVRLSSYTYA
jgi:hypothetical protein